MTINLHSAIRSCISPVRSFLAAARSSIFGPNHRPQELFLTAACHLSAFRSFISPPPGDPCDRSSQVLSRQAFASTADRLCPALGHFHRLRSTAMVRAQTVVYIFRPVPPLLFSLFSLPYVLILGACASRSRSLLVCRSRRISGTRSVYRMRNQWYALFASPILDLASRDREPVTALCPPPVKH